MKQRQVFGIISGLFALILLLIFAAIIVTSIVLQHDTYKIAEASSSANLTIDFLHGNTNNTTQNDSLPRITIMTSGIEDDVSCWSDTEAHDGGGRHYIYDKASLIERMRINYPNTEILHVTELSQLATGEYDYTLYTLTPRYNKSVYTYTYKATFSQADLGKNFIILFSDLSCGSQVTYDSAYNCLHYVIDSIFYELKTIGLTNYKLNLIGHGSGGIANMLYAVNHPYNVHALINISVPLSGADPISLLNGITSMISGSTFCSYLDNTEVTNEIKNSWNSANLGEIIDSHNISCAFDVGFLKNLLNSINEKMLIIDQALNLQTISELCDFYSDNSTLIVNLINEVLGVGDNIEILSKIVANILSALRATTNVYDFVSQFKTIAFILPEEVSDAVTSFFTSLKEGKNYYEDEDDANLNLWYSESGLSISIDDLFGEHTDPVVNRVELDELFKEVKYCVADGSECSVYLGVQNYLYSMTDNIEVPADVIFASDAENAEFINHLITEIFQYAQVPAEMVIGLMEEYDTFANIVSGVVNMIERAPIISSNLITIGIELFKITLYITSGLSSVSEDILDANLHELLEEVVDDVRLKSDTGFSDSFWDKFVFWQDEIIFMMDMIVDYDSQEGMGYSGFHSFKKLFDGESNCNSTSNVLLNILEIPIPHYVETRDEEIINYIMEHYEIAQPSASIYEVCFVDDDSVEITGILGEYDNIQLEIPSNILGRKVIGVAEAALKDLECQSIILPSTLEYICASAFEGNTILCNVVLPNGCKYIGEHAFAGCANLASVNLPDELLFLASSTFMGCNNIIFTPATHSVIYRVENNSIIDNEKRLVKVGKIVGNNYVVQDDVLIIGEYAFAGISNLTSVDLACVEMIEAGAFKDTALNNIVGGSSVKYIGYLAFDGTPWLNNSDFDHVILGDVYVKYNGSLPVVDLSEMQITCIGAGAFENSIVERVVLGNDIETVGRRAFFSLSNFENIIVPVSVLVIEDEAFAGCEQLEIEFLATNAPLIASTAFNHCGDGLRIYVPNISESNYSTCVAFRNYQDSISSRFSHVTFIISDGTAISEIDIPYYSIIGELPIVSLDGYEFIGWMIDDTFIRVGDVWR